MKEKEKEIPSLEEAIWSLGASVPIYALLVLRRTGCEKAGAGQGMEREEQGLHMAGGTGLRKPGVSSGTGTPEGGVGTVGKAGRDTGENL